MAITPYDFNLHGRVENYRARLYELLKALDALVREQMESVSSDKLEGKGRVSYTTNPPRWSLSWRGRDGEYEASLMAFAQGGAWVVHGRTGLNRPFSNLAGARERDMAAIRQELESQVQTDIVLL
jgi:hypothetical protein